MNRAEAISALDGWWASRPAHVFAAALFEDAALAATWRVDLWAKGTAFALQHAKHLLFSDASSEAHVTSALCHSAEMLSKVAADAPAVHLHACAERYGARWQHWSPEASGGRPRPSPAELLDPEDHAEHLRLVDEYSHGQGDHYPAELAARVSTWAKVYQLRANP